MNPLIIIAGPTAGGKSAAAVALAGQIQGSIVSADSMQVYRGMDIGSAKITKAEMGGIPHELIDIIDPAEEWNVVRFQQEAKAAAERIYASGRIPIIAGGTGFYIQALLYDVDFTEAKEDAGFREEMERLAAKEGSEALYQRLRSLDPAAAENIHPHNVKRVIRALEFVRETGGSIASHNEEQRNRPPAYDAAFFVLTRDRAKLYQRIDERVDQMMEKGFLEEVLALRNQGLTLKHVSMQGLGYKQLLEYLDGKWSLEEAVRQMKLQTRHYAKRQITWFKREPSAIWLNADEYHSAKELAAAMLERLTEIPAFRDAAAKAAERNVCN